MLHRDTFYLSVSSPPYLSFRNPEKLSLDLPPRRRPSPRIEINRAHFYSLIFFIARAKAMRRKLFSGHSGALWRKRFD